MFRASLVIFAAVLAASGCERHRKAAVDTAEAPQEKRSDALVAGNMEFLSGTSFALVPIEDAEAGERGIKIVSSGEPPATVRNYVLHDVATGHTSLVFARRAVVLDHLALEHGKASEDEERPERGRTVGVLFSVIEEPDLKADSEDSTPDRVYFLKPGAEGLVALTPEKTERVWWAFDSERDVAFVLFRRDSNGNKELDSSDATELVRFEVGTGKLSTVIDAPLIERAHQLGHGKWGPQ